MSELAQRKCKKFLREGSKFDPDKVEAAVKMMLEGFGEDVNREGLKDTPARVAGFWAELLEGAQYTNEEIAEKFKKDFEVSYNPLVVIECPNVFSSCEHHTVLMKGTVYVAYVPPAIKKYLTEEEIAKLPEGAVETLEYKEGYYYDEKEGFKTYNKKISLDPYKIGHFYKDKDGVFTVTGYTVIGLSKIPRIVDLCAKRLQLQEKLAVDIAECISKAIGTDLIYINTTFAHGCVSARGIKSQGITNATYVTDNLRTPAWMDTRLEIERKVAQLQASHEK